MGLRPGHFSSWWLSWQGPGLPGCSGNQGTRGCQACWRHGCHTPGMGMRWDLGSGDGRCSSSLGLLLALTVPLDPSCSGPVLPPHRVHPGGLDAAERSCLSLTLSYTQMGIDPLSSSLGSGLLSLQLLSLPFTPCFSYLSSLLVAEDTRPGERGQLQFYEDPGPPSKGGRHGGWGWGCVGSNIYSIYLCQN